MHNTIVAIEKYLSRYIQNSDRIFTRHPSIRPSILIYTGDDSRLFLSNLAHLAEFFLKEFPQALLAAQHFSSVWPLFLLSWFFFLYLFFLLAFPNSLLKPLSYNQSCPYYFGLILTMKGRELFRQSRILCKKEEIWNRLKTRCATLFIIEERMLI